ncbi:MAG: hypothetical protein AAFQ08_01415 [Bacteroidota bacterium]
MEDIYAQPAADEASYNLLEQQLWEYYHSPLDLNQAPRETLSTLYILTETQLDHFFRHLARHGPLVSIYELQTIPTLDVPTIRRLRPLYMWTKWWQTIAIALGGPPVY